MSKQLDQTLHNLTLHPPRDEEVVDRLDAVREAFQILAVEIDPNLPDGREKAQCFTALEDACQYAIAAVVRNQ